MSLRTDYKDFILDGSMMGKQRFRNIQNSDGSYSVEDVSVYSQEGDVITASDLNGMNDTCNRISESVLFCTQKATAAGNSAQAAASSASDAQASMTAASNSATAAAGSATDAASAKTAAETAQGKAEDAQTAAETAQGKSEDAQEAAETAQAAAEEAAENAQAIVGIGIMTEQTAGIGKPDGETTEVDNTGKITAVNLAIDDDTWADIMAILS